MLDKVRGLFNYVGRTADAQLQREAMIDLLVWTMYADKLLALSENDQIDRLTEEMEWDSPTPAAQYLNVSLAKIREALDDRAVAEDLMNSIHERLGTDAMRRDAYQACRELAGSDGAIADEEMNFLNSIKQHFALDEER